MFKLKFDDQKKKERFIRKLELVENPEYKYVLTDNVAHVEEDKVNIFYSKDDTTELETLIKSIILGEDYFINLEGIDGVKRTNVRDILYFEAIENEVIAVVGKERFYVLEKLYVLENNLLSKSFVRVSKSFLVNIIKIDYIRPLLNYKLQLVMVNGEKIEVNRSYRKAFQDLLNL